MARIQEFNNQEFLQELRNRVKNNQLAESNIKEAIVEGKKEYQEEIKEKIFKVLAENKQERQKLLAESCERWANHQEEQEEINK